MNRPHRKPRTKPFTLDEYRLDRDYWKQKANEQQRSLDTLENQQYQSQSQLDKLRDARNYFRDELQKICPHDRKAEIGGFTRCVRCQLLVNQTHQEKRRTNP